MRKDVKEPLYALYSKQADVESYYERPWACGFAALTTCMRFLGDRTTLCSDLVAEAKRAKITPKRGMGTDDAIDLATTFGYRAVSNRGDSRWYPEYFKTWLADSFRRCRPVMLSVAQNQDGVENHWWVVYSDLDEDPTSIWVMDPLESDKPFEPMGWRDFFRYADLYDEDDEHVHYDALSVCRTDKDHMPIPPSTLLFNWLNEDIEDAEFAAACLVDNYYHIIASAPSRGNAKGAGSVMCRALLEKNGAVMKRLDTWEPYLHMEKIEKAREVLFDIECYDGHRIRTAYRETWVAEVCLLLVLTTTNLMR